MSKKKPLKIETTSMSISIPLFPGDISIESGGIIKSKSLSSKTHTIESILKNGEKRRWRSGRGRKYGSGEFPPSLLVGLVDDLIEKGKARNLGEAFIIVNKMIGYDEEYVRKVYYKTQKREENRPIVEDIHISHSGQGINFEVLMTELKDFMGKGGLITPENLFRKINNTFGAIKAKESISTYIKEMEKILRMKSNIKAIKMSKKIIKDEMLIEKAKSLI